MTGAFELHAIAQTSTVRIVDCLLEGTMVAVFAGLVLRLSPGKSAGARFALWFSALMAIAALPVLGGLAWSSGAGLPAAEMGKTAITLPSSLALYFFGAWAAIAAWSLLRVGMGLWHMHTLRKSCVPVDPAELNACLRGTLESGRGARPVSLCTSDRVQTPTAIGLVAPLVVFPRWVLEELPADEVKQILLHELAHLRRWDDWTNLLQKLVRAVLFFHPAVWWIESKVSLERELACDDAVLAVTEQPRAYAECLAHLAEKTLVRRSLALAQAMLGRMQQTSRRVAQILDPNRPRETKHAWRWAVPLVSGLVVACAMLAPSDSQLIGFRDVQPSAGAHAIASSSGSALRPIPAAFQRAAEPTISKTVARKRTPRIVLARSETINPKPVPRPVESLDAVMADEDPGVEPSLVHAAISDAASVVQTETVFLVVEHAETGASHQPLYEIQVWRLTVFHPSPHSTSKESPHKET